MNLQLKNQLEHKKAKKANTVSCKTPVVLRKLRELG